MPSNVISIRGVGKEYTIRHDSAAPTTLAEAIVRRVRHPLARTTREQFWALRDVSFDVQRGEVLGLIGGNGAGKSTLLKILSRITEMTEGEVDLYGRVGSLLEVGTGFNQELTGRENIFLNGAILGMRRAEIREQFDAIVAFAGVERFLDTAVKHYSSGMFVRLAFAVAAHLRSEILIVDEVLAVGDVEFQRKCLGKMRDVAIDGRTVLFVSHNMPAIVRLCGRAILLKDGRLIADGKVAAVSRQYLFSGAGSCAERIWPAASTPPGDAVARLRAVRVLDARGELAPTSDIREPVCIEVEYWNLQSGLHPTVSLQFRNEEGVCLFVTNDFSNATWWKTPRRPGIVRCSCRIPGNFLAEGQIFVQVAVCSYNPDSIHAIERDAVTFHVTDPGSGHGVRGVYGGYWPGAVRPRLEWHIATEPDARELVAPRAGEPRAREVE